MVADPDPGTDAGPTGTPFRPPGIAAARRPRTACDASNHARMELPAPAPYTAAVLLAGVGVSRGLESGGGGIRNRNERGADLEIPDRTSGTLSAVVGRICRRSGDAL